MTRHPRTTAFLTATDAPRLRVFVQHRFHRSWRADHQGTPDQCHACTALTDSLMQGLGSRARTEPWAVVDDVVRDLRRRAKLRRSALTDAVRMVAGELGRRPRPDRDAREWFRPALEAAEAEGELTVPARIAERLVEWAIAYGQDPDERPEPGKDLPYRRLANSLSKEFDRGFVANDVEGIWDEIVRACVVHAIAFGHLDHLVLGRGDRTTQVGLEATAADGESTELDLTDDANGLWPARHPAEELDELDEPGSDLVSAAAQAQLAWMSGLARKPSAAARRESAVQHVRSEMLNRHPQLREEPGADRFLDERQPAFAELVDEVLARATLAGS